MTSIRRATCGCCTLCGVDSTSSPAVFCCDGCGGFEPSTIAVSFNIPSVTWYRLCRGAPSVYATIPAHVSSTALGKISVPTLIKACQYQGGNAQLVSFPDDFYTYNCDESEDELWRGSGTGDAIFEMTIRPAANDGYAADITTPCGSFDYCSGLVITYLMRYYNSTLDRYLPQLFNFSWNNGEITNCTYSVPWYGNYVSETPTEKKNNYLSCTIGSNEYCDGDTEYAKDAFS